MVWAFCGNFFRYCLNNFASFGFRRKTPSRGCFTYFSRDRFKEERFKETFNFMVEQAVSLGAVRGTALAVDSTAFKAYNAREAKKGKSDPEADVGLGWKNLHSRL
ncbi:MAG: hypothetical protein QW222_07280 [Candidatus Bathyarchaeia archaeon]